MSYPTKSMMLIVGAKGKIYDTLTVKRWIAKAEREPYISPYGTGDIVVDVTNPYSGEFMIIVEYGVTDWRRWESRFVALNWVEALARGVTEDRVIRYSSDDLTRSASRLGFNWLQESLPETVKNCSLRKTFSLFRTAPMIHGRVAMNLTRSVFNAEGEEFVGDTCPECGVQFLESFSSYRTHP